MSKDKLQWLKAAGIRAVRKDGDPFISRMQGYASEPCGSFLL